MFAYSMLDDDDS